MTLILTIQNAYEYLEKLGPAKSIQLMKNLGYEKVISLSSKLQKERLIYLAQKLSDAKILEFSKTNSKIIHLLSFLFNLEKVT